MEATIKQQERESPHQPMSSSSGCCIINGNKNGVSSDHRMSNNGGAAEVPTTPHALTPKTVTRSESNPYPTTFVQADTTNFKQVVQMLTGSSETVNKQASKPPNASTSPQDPPSLLPNNSKSAIPPKKQGFKLYERRNSLKNSLMINTLIPGFAPNSGFSPRKPEILSPSMLDFPRLALSPVTPLNEDPFNRSSPSLGNSSSEEDRAIAEKGFYLHPSPINTPRDAEPQLLPLFPVTSPRVSGASS
ncbi:VQ domain-containing protein [Psidium guajava]|nr:VQ domain-containing protein [Psidium guajava]